MLPAGITVRPALSSVYRKILDASVSAFNDVWGAVVPTEMDFIRWEGETEFQLTSGRLGGWETNRLGW